MTEVSVWGDKLMVVRKELKPIEFDSCLPLNTGLWKERETPPSSYDNVQLLERGGDWDIMLAWDNNINLPMIYRGHWNDGVVK